MNLCAHVSEERGNGEGEGSQALCACVSEERGNGEGAGSQALSFVWRLFLCHSNPKQFEEPENLAFSRKTRI